MSIQSGVTVFTIEFYYTGTIVEVFTFHEMHMCHMNQAL